MSRQSVLCGSQNIVLNGKVGLAKYGRDGVTYNKFSLLPILIRPFSNQNASFVVIWLISELDDSVLSRNGQCSDHLSRSLARGTYGSIRYPNMLRVLLCLLILIDIIELLSFHL